MIELYPINSVEDVALFLKLSKTTVHRLVARGEIKSIKTIGKTRITKQAVEEFINQ